MVNCFDIFREITYKNFKKDGIIYFWVMADGGSISNPLMTDWTKGKGRQTGLRNI